VSTGRTPVGSCDEPTGNAPTSSPVRRNACTSLEPQEATKMTSLSPREPDPPVRRPGVDGSFCHAGRVLKLARSSALLAKLRHEAPIGRQHLDATISRVNDDDTVHVDGNSGRAKSRLRRRESIEIATRRFFQVCGASIRAVSIRKRVGWRKVSHEKWRVNPPERQGGPSRGCLSPPPYEKRMKTKEESFFLYYFGNYIRADLHNYSSLFTLHSSLFILHS
jgi:hypothetical protein